MIPKTDIHSYVKSIKPLIELDPEDLQYAQDTGDNTDDKRRPAPPVNPSSPEMNEFEK